MRKLATTAALLVITLTAGCKSGPPQIAVQSHGATQLTASVITPLNRVPHSETIPADFVLVLTQNGQTVGGDATVTGGKNAPIHIPIRTGVITQDGKLSLEGDANYTLATAHFSFDGKAASKSLTGKVNVALSNTGGHGTNEGSLTLTPAE
jgi:hypothetical protein